MVINSHECHTLDVLALLSICAQGREGWACCGTTRGPPRGPEGHTACWVSLCCFLQWKGGGSWQDGCVESNSLTHISVYFWSILLRLIWVLPFLKKKQKTKPCTAAGSLKVSVLKPRPSILPATNRKCYQSASFWS